MLAGLLAVSIAVPAHAATAPVATPIDPESTPHGIYVVAPVPRSSTGATFYPLPESAKNSLIVTPDVAAEVGIAAGVASAADRSRVLDNVIAYPELQAKSMFGLTGGGGLFR